MTDRPMTEWETEMPEVHGAHVATCDAMDVRTLVTRANEELAKLRAERDEARGTRARYERMMALSDTVRLDIMWQQLVLERDAALARVRELTEWRPMETAPKGIAAEGPLVILSDGRGTEVTGFWGAGVWVTGLGPYFQPVSWLPLPEPPKDER